MRANPDLYSAHSKVHIKDAARNRGPSLVAERIDAGEGFDTVIPRKPVPNLYQNAPSPHSSAIAASLAMHEAWARNWVGLNQYYANALSLARPFYLFPLGLMQQYFCYLFSFPQWVGEPVGAKPTAQTRLRTQQPQRQWGGGGAGSIGQLDGDGQSEELQRAMDEAIGATTEMWFEIIHEETVPEQPETQQRENEREFALAGAA